MECLLFFYVGFFGGIVGSPFDAVNVRMQNDMKLPPELRRGSEMESFHSL